MLFKERPVPRNVKISQDILNKFGYTPGCAKRRKLSRNEYSHPGLAHSQDCRTRIEAASRTDPVYRDRAERAEQRKIDFFSVREVERIDNPRRAPLEPSVVPGPPMKRKKVKVLGNAKRSRGEPEQDRICQVTCCHPMRFRRVRLQFLSLREPPSSCGMMRTYGESTAPPNSLGVSSGSGVKRAHGESIVNDDETRARISNLIAAFTVWMLQKMTKFAMVLGFLVNGCPHGTLKRT